MGGCSSSAIAIFVFILFENCPDFGNRRDVINGGGE
jgi:hypothetical protein